MIPINLAEIAQILDGEIIGDPSALATGTVETDSNLVSKGSIFFAKPGEKTDGHKFLSQSRQNGAVFAVVEHEVDDVIPQLVVQDTVVALGKLASWLILELRKRGNLRVVGITGSNGKTTTKNMLREILSRVGPTIAPVDSFNNKVGAPVSILRADLDTAFLVVEMGAEGIGSIEYLARMADPDIGVILKVGLAHIGEFGSIENTALIKSELASSLRPEARLVLNFDDAFVKQMKGKTACEVYGFGTTHDSSYFSTEIESSTDGTTYKMHWPDGSTERVRLGILGQVQVMNALAASAVADLLGVSKSKIIEGLESLTVAERWRMQRNVRADGVTIINDAYNASPDSMKAALQTLAQLGRMGSRTIAVLGEMAELGDYSIQEHDAIGRLVVRLNIDQLVVVGAGAKLIHMGASQEGSWDGESKFFLLIDEALNYLRGILTDGDTVLVKSSKSANLRFLGDQLMEADK
jgi:UDP-N-acetylmuramoyl-tripeptide--D-alanyl-D-alanine ligase